MMNIKMILALALGAAALSACSQGEQEATGNTDANAAMIDDSVVSTDNMTDTLGNQMNQLNTTGNVSGADNMTDGAAGNTAANTTNSY